jgi:hypothetical protein
MDAGTATGASAGIRKLKIVFHICAINNAIDVVKEQMSALIYSGLYDDPRLEAVYCFITARDEHSLAMMRTYLMTYYRFKIVIVKEALNDPTYERFTLESMRNLIQDNDADTAVLYMHSKGVSYTDLLKQGNIHCWTKALNYHLIGRYQHCLEALEAPCDVVGAFYCDIPAPHFQGNFWWARGSYLKTLPEHIGRDYLAPEIQYLFTRNPRYVAMGRLPESLKDLYEEPLLPHSYLVGSSGAGAGASKS